MYNVNNLIALSKRVWRAFSSDRHGVAAIEFAMILPIMCLVLICTFELCRGIAVDRRIDMVTNMTADLITQNSSLDDDDLDGIMQIIDELMRPYSATPLKLTATNVIASLSDVENTAVCWTYNHNKGVNSYQEGEVFPLPDGLVTKGESIVVVEVKYEHEIALLSGGTPFLPKFDTTTVALSETLYLKPRVSSSIRHNGESCVLPS